MACTFTSTCSYVVDLLFYEICIRHFKFLTLYNLFKGKNEYICNAVINIDLQHEELNE